MRCRGNRTGWIPTWKDRIDESSNRPVHGLCLLSLSKEKEKNTKRHGDLVHELRVRLLCLRATVENEKPTQIMLDFFCKDGM